MLFKASIISTHKTDTGYNSKRKRVKTKMLKVSKPLQVVGQTLLPLIKTRLRRMQRMKFEQFL
ncbi:hypothetical protein B9Q13_01650 [Candidatus Marsarchaeota G2 archaeon ECH_B_SAG-G16]|nr:MAG: hypothetical protein B9Q00_09325 [Candidatus Marsarchaeota G1 archaeon OSP_C]PSO05512.1 MAG: hypothetical protein B9Q13_01650 [Candidatus Marsarchaeota G2 archaeon ECH_B_SAG-G16]